MALNFPNSPTVDQVYTVDQKSWRWTGAAWNTVGDDFIPDSFGIIAVAGQPNVVADLATDTLTLTAGQGIVLTTDAATDTVTITSSGSYNDLSDKPLLFTGSYADLSDKPTIFNNLTLTGLTTLQQSAEVFNSINAASGTVTHDFATGAVWYHTNPAANFTANFVNVPATTSRAITVVLVLNQGATARMPTAIEINGVGTAINWPGDIVPTPTNNQIDTVSFLLLRVGASWNVLGNLISGGEASSVNALQDLSNVTISNVVDGQVLKYNGDAAQWVNAADLTGAGGTGIALSDLSVSVAAAAGNGTLSYSNTTGIFTFTPPSLAALITLSSISATGDISYNVSTGAISFNNATGYITRSDITAAGDISFNTSTGVISFNNATGYITRSGISVATATASGNGALIYSNSTGVLTYTPPDLSGATGGTASNSFVTIAVAGQSNVVADSATDTLTLVAGSNITITTDAGTDAITIAAASGGTASDSFTTIAVSGQPNVVADSATDTLTLVAGSGIAITTDAATDSVTVTSTVSSGVTAFTGLSDRGDLTVDRFYLAAITMLSTTNNGASSYRFDQYGAAENPTVYALNGATIAFNLNVAGHPFLIQTSGGANYNEGLTHVTTAGVVTTGASAQGKTSGTLYWKIPTSIIGNYRYICQFHSNMVGVITIKDFASI